VCPGKAATSTTRPPSAPGTGTHHQANYRLPANAVLAAALVAAAVAELARAVVIIVVAVVALAAIGGTVLVALRLRHWPPQALQPRVYGSRSVYAVHDHVEPRVLPGRQEVHLHFHGISAEDVAEILADVNRHDR